LTRIACVFVPRFPVAALLRAEPELRGCALVVHDAAAGEAHLRATLVGVSREAARLGVKPGMTVAQAIARHADLLVRRFDVEALAAAHQALAEVAASVSPRVEAAQVSGHGGASSFSQSSANGRRHRTGERSDTRAGALQGTLHGGLGRVYLDASGLERLFGSPGGIAAALVKRCDRVGLEAGVAIADHRATARIAAARAALRGEAIVIPPGGDAAWLAPLPLTALGAVLEPSPGAHGRTAASDVPGWSSMADTLKLLGIEHVGDLARLPPGELTSRFGALGARLWCVAVGMDPTPLAPRPIAPEVSEGASLDHGLASLEALLFVIRGLIDRIVARLALHGLACRGLTVAFGLEDGSRYERAVGVLAPTLDVKALTTLTRLAIEAAPPRAAIETIRLVAMPDRLRPSQLDLFRSPGPAPAELATTLARLAALCGPDRVGEPVAPSGYRPEAWSVVPFAADEDKHPPRPACERDPGVASTALVLRALRPARPAQVFHERGQIAYVRAPGLGGRAIAAAGPWRIEAEWWNDPPCNRDYYDVELSDGGVYRLYHDLRAGDDRQAWFIDGCYD
jgi:protein ImuB